MKIVIAGGTGLIGGALCAALLADGHRPVVLTRGLPPSAVRAGVRYVTWNPPAVDAWVSELAGADAVVNLAGESIGAWPWTARRKQRLRDSRLESTRTLVAAIESLPPFDRPAVLVNASGADVYEGRDEVPATEATPPANTFLARLCLDWEAEALRAQDLGLRVVLARTSLVLAPDATSLRLLALPFRLFAGGPVGSGGQWMSWIALEDAVALVRRALVDPAIRGPLNLAAPDPRRQMDFARAVGSALHRPSLIRTPAWAVRLVLGDQATLALGSRRVWPAAALHAGFVFGQPRLEDALTHVWGDREMRSETGTRSNRA